MGYEWNIPCLIVLYVGTYTTQFLGDYEPNHMNGKPFSGNKYLYNEMG